MSDSVGVKVRRKHAAAILRSAGPPTRRKTLHSRDLVVVLLFVGPTPPLVGWGKSIAIFCGVMGTTPTSKSLAFTVLAVGALCASWIGDSTAEACPDDLHQVGESAESCCWEGQEWREGQCVGRPRSCPDSSIVTDEGCRFDMGHVTLLSAPASRVVVDGVSRGYTPIRLPLTVGAHQVEMSDVTGVNGVETFEIRVFTGHNRFSHRFATRERAASSPAEVGAGTREATEATPHRRQASEPPQEPRRQRRRVAETHGRLVINTIPWSSITLDGRDIGRTPFRLTLPAGEHTLRFRTHQYDETITVQVPADETVRIARRLSRDEPTTFEPEEETTSVRNDRPARLYVNTIPWSIVSVDGRRLGDTPIRGVELPPGRHEVQLRHPHTNIVETRTIELAPGGSHRILERID